MSGSDNRPGTPVTLDACFEGHEDSRRLFDVLRRAVEAMGDVTLRVTKSQVAFRRRRGFAWAWIPAQYLRGKIAPLVLSVDLDHRSLSPRWKQVVEPRPGRFMHHLELHEAADIDDQVAAWLREAWERAG